MTGADPSARIETAATALADYDGAPAPTDFGDVEAEYRALTSATALVALPHRREIRVEGDERVDYLQGQLTNDVRALTPGAGQASLLLNAQGRVEAMLALYGCGDRIEIVTDAAQLFATIERLGRFLVADDVEIEADPSAGAFWFALVGPRAPELVAKLAGANERQMNGWERSEIEVANGAAVAYSRDDFRVPAIELRCAEPLRAWDAAAALGAVPTGTTALERVRIESGTPRFGVDVDDGRIAMEARLEWAIHFAKGCYVGQEIIERAVSRGRLNRRIALLESDSAIAVGATVDGENEKCAVTSACDSPESGRLCLAYLPIEKSETGSRLAFDNGSEARVLPWPRKTVLAGRGS